MSYGDTQATDNPHGMNCICYLVSGLGATGELFGMLKLPPWLEVRALEWEPCRAKDTMAQYAERLLPQVDAERPHIYIGVSFGAAVAVELALHTRPLLTIIISGVTTRSEIPFYLKYLRALGAYNLAPWVVRLWTPLLRFGAKLAFGAKDPATLDLLVRMIQSIDPKFYECGLKALMGWKNETLPGPVFSLHGSSDRLLPVRYVQPDVTIAGGGHMIVCTHGAEVSSIIRKALDELLREQSA